MNVYLIRHGMTKGNMEKRYVGRTDESLLESEKKRLCMDIGPQVQKLYVSPMRRCIETADCLWNQDNLYPGKPERVIVPAFRECDFGRFEYHNYQELNGTKEYQDWVDSGGTLPFPEGESVEAFKRRCQRAFYQIMKAEWKQEPIDRMIGLVVHGGTIMAVLDGFSSPHKDYFDWQCPNREGYVCEVLFMKDTLRLTHIAKIGGGRWNG
ncbi:MAG: histidine phosphatase family protein [Clostridiales bacterium]|nr:histidine phosphatase family protein [Clostridiales bacterium]